MYVENGLIQSLAGLTKLESLNINCCDLITDSDLKSLQGNVHSVKVNVGTKSELEYNTMLMWYIVLLLASDIFYYSHPLC